MQLKNTDLEYEWPKTPKEYNMHMLGIKNWKDKWPLKGVLQP